MGTASIHEGVRRMRFSSLLDRQERGEITQEEAAEMLGVHVRTFQRWATGYEDEGAAARAGADARALPRQVRGLHGEAFSRAAGEAARLQAGLHGDQAQSPRGRPGEAGAPPQRPSQEAAAAAAAGHDAASGRLAPRLDRGPAADGPDRDAR